jgi:hypothetical protein
MNTRAIITATLLVAAPVAGLCTEEEDLVARLQTLHSEWRGAAASTRLSLLEGLRDDLNGVTARVCGLFGDTVFGLFDSLEGATTPAQSD